MEEGIFALRCGKCGRMTATYAVVCASCGAGGLERVRLNGEGKVRSFTILNVPTEEFALDAPYAYAVIDMSEGCSTSGWMPSVRSAGDIAVGDSVRFSGRRGRASIFVKS